MKSLVFFLEEYSARAMLEGLLPRLLPDGWLVRYPESETLHRQRCKTDGSSPSAI